MSNTVKVIKSILDFTPNAKQLAFLSDKSKSKAASCGNWTGKTMMQTAEEFYHLTGLYPEWWDGVRYDRPVSTVMVDPNMLRSRDCTQSLMLEAIERIGDIEFEKVPKPGVPDAMSELRIKHVSGGMSKVVFLSAEMSCEKFTVFSVDRVAINEGVRGPVLVELRVRRGASDGVLSAVYTPLEFEYHASVSSFCSMHNIAMSDCEWIDQSVANSGWIPEDEHSARVFGLVADE
jgi:hypothetical protein